MPRSSWPLSSRKMWKSCDQRRYGFPNVVDDRFHISSRFLDITLPIREGLVQVEDRRVLADRHLVEEGNVQPELFLDEFAVAKAHRNDEVIPVDDCFGQRLWNVCGRIGSFLDQSVGNHRMDRFGLGFRPRGFDSVGRLLTELSP